MMRKSTVATRCLVLLALLCARTVVAGPVTYSNLVFDTSGQSMWGPGNAPGFDETLPLIASWNTPTATIGTILGNKDTVIIPGTDAVTTKVYEPKIWVPTPSFSHPFAGHYTGCGCWKTVTIIPEIPPVTGDTRTGGIATARTYGEVGFQVGAKADSGSVDATVKFDAGLVVPDVIVKNKPFSLNPDGTLLADSTFHTNSPEVSGKAEAVLGAQAELGGQVCFIGFGCSPDEDTATTTIGFPTKTLEIVSFNDVDSPGQIKVLGVLDPAAFQFGQPIDVPLNTPGVNFGNVTVSVPHIDATGAINADGAKLSGGGESDFLALKADIDGLILNAFGLPAVLGASLNAGIFNVSYDLIDVEYGPTLQMLQDFEMTPTLMVDLGFSHPVNIDGVGVADHWSGVWNSLPLISLLDSTDVLVTPDFYVDVLFKNSTSLGVAGDFLLSVLSASFSLEAYGLSLDVGSLGPLFEIPHRDDLFDFPPLFLNTFSLGGFDHVAGEPFALRLTSVPEPGTLFLVGLAVALLALAPRRRYSRTKIRQSVV